MKTLRLLQIGDIHFPEAAKKTFQDVKDNSFPAPIREIGSAKPLQNTMRRMVQLCDQNLDGIVICGDLTSYGNLQGYIQCIEYLDKLLGISRDCGWAKGHIHVVPGNHDIDRQLCDSSEEGLFKKFETLNTAWSDLDLEVLATRSVRKTEIVSSDDCHAMVFSLNSCVGCGEKWYLPEPIREELKSLLNQYAEDAGFEKAFDLIGQDLDTPCFIESDITEVCDDILSLDDKSIPVIVTHHNVLPQAIPRIALYSEVLNAGLLRSRLSKLPKPVIYCHGHIHDNPVELVHRPGNNPTPLICISAKEAIDGFNIITIEFGRKGFPLGCIVTPFQIDNDGFVEINEPKRIPLQPYYSVTKLSNNIISDILPYIPNDYNRFEIVLNLVRDALGKKIKSPTLSDALLEAEWFGLVEILDRTQESVFWQVRRITP